MMDGAGVIDSSVFQDIPEHCASLTPLSTAGRRQGCSIFNPSPELCARVRMHVCWGIGGGVQMCEHSLAWAPQQFFTVGVQMKAPLAIVQIHTGVHTLACKKRKKYERLKWHPAAELSCGRNLSLTSG